MTRIRRHLQRHSKSPLLVNVTRSFVRVFPAPIPVKKVREFARSTYAMVQYIPEACRADSHSVSHCLSILQGLLGSLICRLQTFLSLLGSMVGKCNVFYAASITQSLHSFLGNFMTPSSRQICRNDWHILRFYTMYTSDYNTWSFFWETRA